jgi:hypothetical protein
MGRSFGLRDVPTKSVGQWSRCNSTWAGANLAAPSKIRADEVNTLAATYG